MSENFVTLVVVLLLVIIALVIAALTYLIHKQQNMIDDESKRLLAITSEILAQRTMLMSDVNSLSQELLKDHEDRPIQPQPTGPEEGPFDPHEEPSLDQ